MRIRKHDDGMPTEDDGLIFTEEIRQVDQIALARLAAWRSAAAAAVENIVVTCHYQRRAIIL